MKCGVSMKKFLFAVLICTLIASSGCMESSSRNTDLEASSGGGARISRPLNTEELTSQSSGEDAILNSFDRYLHAWGQFDYESMYSMLSNISRERISREDFQDIYEKIYGEMDVENFTVEIDNSREITFDDFERAEITFNVSMDCLAGSIEFSHKALAEEPDGDGDSWKIIWNKSMIFPEMEKDDTVKVDVKRGTRGKITDRDSNLMAQDGTVFEIGIVPERLGDNAESIKQKAAEALNIKTEDIDRELNKSYVKPYMFIPIKTISYDKELLDVLEAIQGIMAREKDARVYPLGEKAAHLVGYVRNVTMGTSEQQLEELLKQGYDRNDVIGKVGLEKLYEDVLRPRDGVEIYIENRLGSKKKTLARKEYYDGRDFELTIDSKIQEALYDELKGDMAAGVVINPETGEVLALVSTPSYNPNKYITGFSNSEWTALSSNAAKPFFNRFQARYVPGSSFKPVTAAIGLKTGKLDPDKDKSIQGVKWQKSSNWGSYFITRIREYDGPSNLENAFVYSDNIYFARTALDMGRENLLGESLNLGMGERLPFDFPMAVSLFDPDGVIESEIQLADSGYGQGQILMNPLHLAAIYGAFINQGKIMKPQLFRSSENIAEIWKEDAFPAKEASKILRLLRLAVENPESTAHGCMIPGKKIAGKTGTAEIKLRQDDKKGSELGWFAAIHVDDPKLVAVVMIEDVKERGGSHYVVPKVKSFLEKVLK